MEVLSYVRDNNWSDNSFAIIKVSQQELRQIIGSEGRDAYPKNGAVLSLSPKYRHAMSILAESTAIKELPNQLRAFATALETTHPAIAQVTDPPVTPSNEELAS